MTNEAPLLSDAENAIESQRCHGNLPSHVESYEDEHWEDRAADEGKYAKYVRVRFDILLNPELDPKAVLPRKELDSLSPGADRGNRWHKANVSLALTVLRASPISQVPI
jgi:hypothetical protein